MDDVTDTVFRQIIADCAPPDVYFTEFVNVDGLQSPGREKLLKKLQFSAKEKPLIAQLWGKIPENYYKTAREIADGTLIDEIARHNQHFGSSKVQGSNENRANSTGGTESETRKQLTQQFAESDSRVTSSASEQTIVASGFAGIDINFGCPDKSVVKNGCCIGMINNRELTGEIIEAVREGVKDAGSSLPVSVKTRLGLKDVDYTWHEFLLKQKLNMLTIHGRTAAEMSKVPNHWDAIQHIREMRDVLCPSTLIVGNGDVMNHAHGLELAKKHGLDGIMIGRGVFHDPFAFAASPAGGSPFESMTVQEKIDLYRRHVQLFADTWKNNERPIHTLNKFCKIYINGFDGAKELREKLMAANSAEELLTLLG